MDKKNLALGGYLLAVHVAAAAMALHFGVMDRLAIRAGLIAPPTDAAATAAHASRLERVHIPRDLQAPAGSIVFLGDSHTEALLESNIAPQAVNHGVSGQTSDQLLATLGRYPSLAHAAVVVITTGTNDLMQGRERGIGDRYRAILAGIPSGVPVVMSSVPPNTAHDARPLVEAARATCAAHKHCTFVNLFAALDGRDDVLQPDGAHLLPRGYAIWTERLQHALAHVTTPSRRARPAAP
jgi:lysophospholipase L1-like esterase